MLKRGLGEAHGSPGKKHPTFGTIRFEGRDPHLAGPGGLEWRKYAHKFLSGVHVRRIYYSCSEKESRSCPAKKVVDREATAPRGDWSNDMVSLVGEHNHPPTAADVAHADVAHADEGCSPSEWGSGAVNQLAARSGHAVAGDSHPFPHTQTHGEGDSSGGATHSLNTSHRRQHSEGRQARGGDKISTSTIKHALSEGCALSDDPCSSGGAVARRARSVETEMVRDWLVGTSSSTARKVPRNAQVSSPGGAPLEVLVGMLLGVPGSGHVAAERGHVAAERGHVAAERGHVAAERGHVAAERGQVSVPHTVQSAEHPLAHLIQGTSVLWLKPGAAAPESCLPSAGLGLQLHSLKSTGRPEEEEEATEVQDSPCAASQQVTAILPAHEQRQPEGEGTEGELTEAGRTVPRAQGSEERENQLLLVPLSQAAQGRHSTWSTTEAEASPQSHLNASPSLRLETLSSQQKPADHRDTTQHLKEEQAGAARGHLFEYPVPETKEAVNGGHPAGNTSHSVHGLCPASPGEGAVPEGQSHMGSKTSGDEELSLKVIEDNWAKLVQELLELDNGASIGHMVSGSSQTEEYSPFFQAHASVFPKPHFLLMHEQSNTVTSIHPIGLLQDSELPEEKVDESITSSSAEEGPTGHTL